MEQTNECSHPRHDDFPMYGPAPHECFFKKGPEFKIGQSTLLPVDDWPPNFILEVPEGEKAEDQVYPNAYGVYFCPGCYDLMPASRVMSDRVNRNNQPPHTEGG
jgi:hypothetical protein